MYKCTRAHAYIICMYSENKLNTPWPCCKSIYTHTYTLQTHLLPEKNKHIIPGWKQKSCFPRTKFHFLLHPKTQNKLAKKCCKFKIVKTNWYICMFDIELEKGINKNKKLICNSHLSRPWAIWRTFTKQLTLRGDYYMYNRALSLVANLCNKVILCAEGHVVMFVTVCLILLQNILVNG